MSKNHEHGENCGCGGGDEKIKLVVDDILDIVRNPERVLRKISEPARWDKRKDDSPYFSHEAQTKRAKKYYVKLKKYFAAAKKQFNQSYRENGESVFLFFRAEEKDQFSQEKWESMISGTTSAAGIGAIYSETFVSEMKTAYSEVYTNTVKIHSLEVATSSSFVPLDAINEFENYELEFSKTTAARVDENMKNIIRHGLENGLSNRDLANNIRGKFDRLSGYEAMRIARTETVRASNRGAMAAYKSLGVEKYNVLMAVGACPICVDKVAANPYKIDDNAGRPVFHPHPVSEDTEFLSSDGWKLVKNAKIGEKAFSLNPDTGKMEWIEVVNVVNAGKAPNGRMVNFKSYNSDFLFTEDHHVPYIFGKYKTIKSVDAGEAMKMKRITVPRTGEWCGKKSKMSNEMIQFLALWISDGSCVKKGEDSFYITISTRKYRKFAKEIIEKITDKKVYIRESRVEFNDSKIGRILKEIGNSFDTKKIPQKIMSGTKKEIILFLETYLIADGSIQNIKSQFGISQNKVFFTASKILSAQLSELILKAGGFPSFSFQDNSKNPQTINGRIIKSKNIINRIRWCITKNATFGENAKGNMTFVPYDGIAYCLTLKTNHIFYCRRKGKCIWTGNCRCSVEPIL